MSQKSMRFLFTAWDLKKPPVSACYLIINSTAACWEKTYFESARAVTAEHTSCTAVETGTMVYHS